MWRPWDTTLWMMRSSKTRERRKGDVWMVSTLSNLEGAPNPQLRECTKGGLKMVLGRYEKFQVGVRNGEGTIWLLESTSQTVENTGRSKWIQCGRWRYANWFLKGQLMWDKQCQRLVAKVGLVGWVISHVRAKPAWQWGFGFLPKNMAVSFLKIPS
jgi:hypothetical protein